MIDDVSGAGVVAAGHVADWRHWVWLITGRNVCPHHHGWIRGLTPGVVRGFLAQTSLCKALGKPFRLLNLQDVWSDDPQIYATEMELMHDCDCASLGFSAALRRGWRELRSRSCCMADDEDDAGRRVFVLASVMEICMCWAATRVSGSCWRRRWFRCLSCVRPWSPRAVDDMSL
jgi:hypothetical protein